MVLKNHKIFMPINIQEYNLPIIYNLYVSSAQNKHHGTVLISGMAFIGLDSLGLISGIRTDIDSSGTEGKFMLTDEFEHFYQFCRPCIGSSENKNVTDPQKEFLPWHWDLGISMYHIK